VHAFSWPLLTASDGSKLGKTAGAWVWLDAARTSPYQFRQHWMQVTDDAVEAQLLTFSLRPVEAIRDIVAEHREAPHLRVAQRALADDMVTLVHGTSAAQAAAEAADLLFNSDPTSASEAALTTLADEIPFSRLPVQDLDDLVAVFASTGLASSKGDARRTLAQHAFYANGVQLDEDARLAGRSLLHGRYLLLRKGKKSHHLVEVFS
jgi:tyrosyl-tRNA synthetase